MAATEFRLFRFGENPTEKGTFVLTKADAAACVAAWKARGTDLSLDYEHDVTREGFGPRPAAGWCGLEVRGDGLWAVAVRWTKRALELLDAKEYRYFSPFFEHDEAGHVRNIVNVALTNIPATHGIAPLVAATALAAKRRGVRGPVSLITTGRGGGLKRSTTSMAMSEEKKALADKICAAVLAAFNDGSGDDEDKKMGEGTASANEPPPSDKGDDDDSRAAAAALCALTGEASPMAALAKISAALEGGSGGDPKAAHAHRVELLSRDGKIPPALKATALTWTPEQLEAFVKASPGVKTTTGGGARPPAQGGGAVTLSAQDKEICKRMGVAPEKFLEAKAKLASGGIPQGTRKVALDGAHHLEESPRAERDDGPSQDF